MAGVAATFIALTVGLVLTSSAWLLAQRERDAKDEALLIASSVKDFLTQTLAAANPEHQARNVTVREILDDASKKLDTQFQNRPAVQAELRTTNGRTYHGLGEYDKAVAEQRHAVNLWKQVVPTKPHQQINAMLSLADSLYRKNLPYKAEKLLDEVLELCHQDLDKFSVEAVRAWSSKGTVLAQQGRLNDAKSVYEKALAYRERVGTGRQPRTFLDFNYGMLLVRLGELEQARELFEHRLEIETDTLGAKHPQTLATLSALALVLRSLNPEAALEPYKQAVALKTEVLGPTHDGTLGTINHYARALSKVGQHELAEKTLLDAIELVRVTHNTCPPLFLDFALSRVRLAAGHADALATLRRTAARYKEEPSRRYLLCNDQPHRGASGSRSLRRSRDNGQAAARRRR